MRKKRSGSMVRLRGRCRHLAALTLLGGAIVAGYWDISLANGIIPYLATYQIHAEVRGISRDLRETYTYINAKRYNARSAEVARAYRKRWLQAPKDPNRMAAYAYAHLAATSSKVHDELCDDNLSWRNSLAPYAEEAKICRQRSLELLPKTPEALVMAAEAGLAGVDGEFRWHRVVELLETAIELSPDWYAPYLRRAEIHDFASAPLYTKSPTQRDNEFRKGIACLERAGSLEMPLESRYHLEWVRKRLYMFQRDYSRAVELQVRGIELAKQIGAPPRRIEWMYIFLKHLKELEAEKQKGAAPHNAGSGAPVS